MINNRYVVLIGVGIFLLTVIYFMVGIWYYDFGRRPNYEDVDDNGNTSDPVLVSTMDWDGSKWQDYEQELYFEGYEPRVVPEMLENIDIINGIWRPLGVLLSPVQWVIKLSIKTPDRIIDPYTVIDGKRLLNK